MHLGRDISIPITIKAIFHPLFQPPLETRFSIWGSKITMTIPHWSCSKKSIFSHSTHFELNHRLSNIRYTTTKRAKPIPAQTQIPLPLYSLKKLTSYKNIPTPCLFFTQKQDVSYNPHSLPQTYTKLGFPQTLICKAIFPSQI